MIVNRAYSGKKVVYRAYYNEQLIWDYGKCNRGNAFASLEASMMPYLTSQDSAQMLASALMDGFVTAEVPDFENIMAHANMSARTNVAPYALSPIQIAGTEFITVRATIVPFTFDIVCARGDATMKLATYGHPDEITAVNGAGVTKANIVDSLCPTLENVMQILATAGATTDWFFEPKIQAPERIATDLCSNFISNCSPAISPIRTVTFMSNCVEIYQAKVVDGYDCPDPMETGAITTPTKGMTAQYTYEFSGWSLTDGGEANANALSSITKDALVYAAFNESIRYYTITYYDDDGTILREEAVAYGSMPSSYIPTKTDYAFDKWSPEFTAVTGDTSYYAVWVDKIPFATSTWAKIAELSESGLASRHFSIGATKTFTTKHGVTVTARVIGFNHDDLADGTGKAGMTLELNVPAGNVSINGETTSWYSSGSSVHAKPIWWGNTELRNYWNMTTGGWILTADLPADLTKVIKQVRKITYKTPDGVMSYSDDFLWLPSSKELGFTVDTSYGIWDEGECYEIYTPNKNRTTAYPELIKYNNGTAVLYRTRSKENSTKVGAVSATGAKTSSSLGTNQCAFPCFCI